MVQFYSERFQAHVKGRSEQWNSQRSHSFLRWILWRHWWTVLLKRYHFLCRLCHILGKILRNHILEIQLFLADRFQDETQKHQCGCMLKATKTINSDISRCIIQEFATGAFMFNNAWLYCKISTITFADPQKFLSPLLSPQLFPHFQKFFRFFQKIFRNVHLFAVFITLYIWSAKNPVWFRVGVTASYIFCLSSVLYCAGLPFPPAIDSARCRSMIYLSHFPCATHAPFSCRVRGKCRAETPSVRNTARRHSCPFWWRRAVFIYKEDSK